MQFKMLNAVVDCILLMFYYTKIQQKYVSYDAGFCCRNQRNHVL